MANMIGLLDGGRKFKGDIRGFMFAIGCIQVVLLGCKVVNIMVRKCFGF